MSFAPLLAWSVRRADWLIVGLGIVLRVAQYLANKPMWMDELALRGNILAGSTRVGLFGPLLASQLAPPGFLAIERFVCAIFGGSKLALRLVPMLGGVASMVLFWKLARVVFRRPTLLIALGMFAVCDDLIAYSAELKQYETDVTFALLVTWMGVNLATRPLTWRRGLTASAVGALVVWFSHPSAFVLAGVGSSLMVAAAVDRRWRQVGIWLGLSLSWACSFAAVHAVAMNQLGHRRDMWVFWGFAFPPRPPASVWEAAWPLWRFLYIFINPLDYYWPFDFRLSPLPALGFFLVGCASLWKRDRILLGMLMAPVGFALLAAELRLYPFHGRLILFLAPAFLLIIAEGAGRVGERFERRGVWAVVLGSILFFPTLLALYHLETPRVRYDYSEHGDRRSNRLDPRGFPF